MTYQPSSTAADPWPRSEPPALTPGAEQRGLRSAVRGLLTKHSDVASTRDIAETEPGFSRDLWGRLVDEMSVAALAVPESNGGLGYGTVELGIILEECGRALICEPVLSSAIVGTQALLLGAADGAVAPLLAQAVDDGLVVAVSTLDPVHDGVRAEKTDGQWSLVGRATHVVAGNAADVVVVSAEAPDGRQIFAAGAETTSRIDRKVIDPTRRQTDIVFEGVSALPLIGTADVETFRTRIADLTTLALACENTGMTDRLLELTLDHVATREQFGRPIGSFQAIKHRLADLLMTLESARSASRYAAAVYADDPDDARLAVAVAGAVCTDAAIEAASEAIQLHGGVGFTWEHPVHSYFRRALGNEALQGDSRSHRARIAELIGI
ncbi:acyl-CoA dehydrogenase family protein [Williamsia sp. R60]